MFAVRYIEIEAHINLTSLKHKSHHSCDSEERLTGKKSFLKKKFLMNREFKVQRRMKDQEAFISQTIKDESNFFLSSLMTEQGK